ncbi:MAG: flagellar assembly protein FliW [Clostridiales bacterium]
MKYQTRDFGEIEIDVKQILTFNQPIYGFEDNGKYAFLQDPQVGKEIAWLQSLEESELCFILVAIRSVVPMYRPELPRDAEKLLGKGEYDYWAIAVIKDDFTKSTVNLKSPIIINWQTGFGAQMILEGDYPVRHPLMEEAKGSC